MNQENETYNDPAGASPGKGLTSILRKLKERRKKIIESKSPEPEKDQCGVDENFNKVKSYEQHMIKDDKCKVSAPSVIEKKIIRQVEYYYGDFNLPRDKFLQELINENPDGWVSMDHMLTFKRLSDLSRDADCIMEALCKSKAAMIDVDFVNRRIRRNPEKRLPELTESRKMEVEERTLFISGFKKDTTLDSILEFFEHQIEGVSNVRMRYYRNDRPRPSGDSSSIQEITNDTKNRSIFVKNDDSDSRRFMGSIFVTFNTKKLSDEFQNQVKCGNPGEGKLQFNGQDLNVKIITARQFYQRRVENNDQFIPETIGKTVYVQGFDKADTNEKELLDYFSNFEGSLRVRKRCYRSNASEDDQEGEWIFTGSIFLTFESVDHAKKFVAGANNLNYKGDKLKVKWQDEFYEEKGKFKKELSEFRK